VLSTFLPNQSIIHKLHMHIGGPTLILTIIVLLIKALKSLLFLLLKLSK